MAKLLLLDIDSLQGPVYSSQQFETAFDLLIKKILADWSKKRNSVFKTAKIF